MSPFVRLALNLAVILAIALIWRALAPYLEKLCADRGAERFYHLCAAAVHLVMLYGVMMYVIAFALRLVLKAIGN